MARPKVKVNSETVARAEEALGKIKESKLAIQLKAIIASAEYPVENVGTILKVSARSIFRWIAKFNEKGVEGLRDRPKGHMRSKLTEEHKRELEYWIVHARNIRGEPVHWTLKKLKRELGKEHGIYISTTPLWKHLKKMGLGLRKPRPVHAKADIAAQDAFKKN
ncbi:MAG: helix-turn-helix domain-containing protein [Pseudomonadota bacterium]